MALAVGPLFVSRPFARSIRTIRYIYADLLEERIESDFRTVMCARLSATPLLNHAFDSPETRPVGRREELDLRTKPGGALAAGIART